jgi:hypothetical protein
MAHPLVLGLFDNAAQAAGAARALRELNVPREQISIVARSHDEAGVLAQSTGASPGAELEDSPAASRLGELSAHLIAAIALVLPGIGPIVADGPLAAEFGEAAGHLGGDIGRILTRAGLAPSEAEAWERQVEQGAILVGAHTDDATLARVRATMSANGAVRVESGTWGD